MYAGGSLERAVLPGVFSVLFQTSAIPHPGSALKNNDAHAVWPGERPAGKSPPRERNEALFMGMDAIYTRRSIRKFRPDALPRDVIDAILDAARVAPSGKNAQPWRFVVLGGESKAAFCACMEAGLQREADAPLLPESRGGLPDAWHTLGIMRQAPVLVAVLNCCDGSPFAPSSAGERVSELVNTQSIGAAIQNMLLKAEDLSVGSLWIANTFFAYPELTAFLETERQLVAAVALGYAGEQPNARPRKPLESLVTYRL